jgi:hypothetical protein
MPTKKIKKELKKKYQPKPKISLDEWEEAMRGDHSYDDIDYLNQANAEVLDQIHYWENHKPSSWLGNWYRQIQIDKLKKKLHHYQPKEKK